MKLSELSIGSTATILRVGGQAHCASIFGHGLIQGTEVTVVKYAPMGDPVELRIHGYELTIRLADAENIETSEPHKPKTSKKKVAKPEKHHPGYGEGGKFHDRNHENPLSDSETLTFALVGKSKLWKDHIVQSVDRRQTTCRKFPGCDGGSKRWRNQRT